MADHVRGDKIPTYLAAVGGLNAMLWGLAIAVTFPVLTFAAAVGVVAGASFSENVREKLKKIGDQIRNYGHDLKSHVKEDVHRVTGWWSKRREAKQAEKAASIERAAAAFRGGSTKQEFNAAAPAAGVTPAVIPAPEAPKPPVIVPPNPA